MCGGYTLAKQIEKIEERFNAELMDGQFFSTMNARPGQFLPIITSENPVKIQLAHWGLKPPWLEKVGIKRELINTRNDSILKPAFKRDLQSRRCLIIADGFLEWEKTGAKTKTPHRYGVGENELFSMAGIYERDETGQIRFSIITTDANEVVAKVHDRMPVMLPPEAEKDWLEKLDQPEKYLDFLHPYPEKNFKDQIVPPKIGNSLF